MSRSSDCSGVVPETHDSAVVPAHAGNAPVREMTPDHMTQSSQTTVPPPPTFVGECPPMRFEVEVQSPLALGTELTANPSGGVVAVDSASGPAASTASTTAADTDVDSELMEEPLYRFHQQFIAVQEVVADMACRPPWPVQPRPGYVMVESSGTAGDASRRASIVAPGQCTGEQVRYRDGGVMRYVEALWMYRARQDGRAACTISIERVPFSMSERSFCKPFLHVGEVVALHFPREECACGQAYKSQGTCTIRYRDPQHASIAVRRFNGVTVYPQLKPLKVKFAEREFGIEPPHNRNELAIGKPRFYGRVPHFPAEEEERPGADWARQGKAGLCQYCE